MGMLLARHHAIRNATKTAQAIEHERSLAVLMEEQRAAAARIERAEVEKLEEPAKEPPAPTEEEKVELEESSETASTDEPEVKDESDPEPTRKPGRPKKNFSK